VAAAAFDRVLDELRRAPGVEFAAAGSTAPLGPCCSSNGLVPEGRPLSGESVINAYSRFVTPEYFETLRIPLLRGRLFTDRDTRQAPLVMIVNEELARLAWPGEDPIGKRIVCCEGTPENPSLAQTRFNTLLLTALGLAGLLLAAVRRRIPSRSRRSSRS